MKEFWVNTIHQDKAFVELINSDNKNGTAFASCSSWWTVLSTILSKKGDCTILESNSDPVYLVNA
jgi:hypothetical protein